MQTEGRPDSPSLPIHTGAALLGQLDVQTAHGYKTSSRKKSSATARPTLPAAGRPGRPGGFDRTGIQQRTPYRGPFAGPLRVCDAKEEVQRW
ncbi:hypothetical protein StoSoilA2_19690 [Arthrobacter sp. StoSoilA2]|uniref:hypothetical protein n=1 Tax=Arthrobacter sp. StoSoilA2 TaxID=2830990 RepID=UPI001CC7203F|nr:hypothetical protein [Arthrobacter sp. StoSoilA2]BCW35913.1 hypothetical protein StoSoilA2_19690 [Arthrobacter sp. StoSoilA2]